MRKVSVLLIFVFLGAVFFAPAAHAAQRNYMMVFEVMKYNTQLKKAVVFFLDDIIKPGDQLLVVTPVKTYGFTSQQIHASKKKFTASLLTTLKKDLQMGGSRYRTILDEMARNVLDLNDGMRNVITGIKGILQNYKRGRKSLWTLKSAYELRLLSFAKIFRRVRGDNHLLMFYQKVLRPVPDSDTMTWLRSNQIYGSTTVEAFLDENYRKPIDLEKVEAVFKYANVKFHFSYLQNKTIRNRSGMTFVDDSQDMYDIFSRLARLTQGIKLTTANPTAFVKQLDLLVKGTVEVEVQEEEMK